MEGEVGSSLNLLSNLLSCTQEDNTGKGQHVRPTDKGGWVGKFFLLNISSLAIAVSVNGADNNTKGVNSQSACIYRVNNKYASLVNFGLVQ